MLERIVCSQGHHLAPPVISVGAWCHVRCKVESARQLAVDYTGCLLLKGTHKRKLYSQMLHTMFCCFCDPEMLHAVHCPPSSPPPSPSLFCLLLLSCIVLSGDPGSTKSFFRVVVTLVPDQHSVRGWKWLFDVVRVKNKTWKMYQRA